MQAEELAAALKASKGNPAQADPMDLVSYCSNAYIIDFPLLQFLTVGSIIILR
jgi:hypothetical protein